MITAISHEAAVELQSLTREEAIDRLAEAQIEMADLITRMNDSRLHKIDYDTIHEMLTAYRDVDPMDAKEHSENAINQADEPLGDTGEPFEDMNDSAVGIQNTLLNL